MTRLPSLLCLAIAVASTEAAMEGAAAACPQPAVGCATRALPGRASGVHLASIRAPQRAYPAPASLSQQALQGAQVQFAI